MSWSGGRRESGVGTHGAGRETAASSMVLDNRTPEAIILAQSSFLPLPFGFGFGFDLVFALAFGSTSFVGSPP